MREKQLNKRQLELDRFSAKLHSLQEETVQREKDAAEKIIEIEARTREETKRKESQLEREKIHAFEKFDKMDPFNDKVRDTLNLLHL